MGERIVIYGGAGGIGGATARWLHERGHELHLVGRREAPLAALARELGAGVTVGDVTDERLFERVAAEAGERLAGLVYAVGTITLRPFGRLAAEDFLQDFRVNTLGAALAVQAHLPALQRGERGAGVVLFSSVAALQGFKLHASIATAKAALSGLTLSLAAELAPRVRVNAIAPSLTRTPLADPIIPSEPVADAIAKLHPLPRLGSAQEIAALAGFLLSPDAGWITGQIISVDGGRSTLRVKG